MHGTIGVTLVLLHAPALLSLQVNQAAGSNQLASSAMVVHVAGVLPRGRSLTVCVDVSALIAS